ncbi:MAG: histidinol-phosphate transaminase [Bowdeniella nasicola]|nr:histidinol-phosphate transaminase [Bowdeniella nasicola]
MAEPHRTVAPAYIRPDILSLPAYVPGARPPEGVVMTKLSSNESPTPTSPAVRAALESAVDSLNRYPDMAVTSLTEALADHCGVRPEMIACGNGSVALLAHALSAVSQAGDDVVYAWRSFEAYPIVAQTVGARSIRVPLTAESAHDLAAMSDAITERTRAVIVCNPNNPTGRGLTRAEILDFVASVPPKVNVFLDEAYQEYVTLPESSWRTEDCETHPNVLVFRTFSKAYGLAGLRVGYVIGQPRTIAAVRATSTPFGVNSLAQVAACAALADQDTMRAGVQAIVAERKRVSEALRELGYDVPDSQANFVYLPEDPHWTEGNRAESAGAQGFSPGAPAELIAAMAREEGILLRAFAGDGLRMTVGTPEENDRLLDFFRRRGSARGC